MLPCCWSHYLRLKSAAAQQHLEGYRLPNFLLERLDFFPGEMSYVKFSNSGHFLLFKPTAIWGPGEEQGVSISSKPWEKDRLHQQQWKSLPTSYKQNLVGFMGSLKWVEYGSSRYCLTEGHTIPHCCLSKLEWILSKIPTTVGRALLSLPFLAKDNSSSIGSLS